MQPNYRASVLLFLKLSEIFETRQIRHVKFEQKCMYLVVRSHEKFYIQPVKEPSSFIFYPPTPSFSSPHLHFRPPKPIHFLISIPPTYFH